VGWGGVQVRNVTLRASGESGGGGLRYVKLLMYLYFYMALGPNDFDVCKFITRAIGRGGP
jgi:hypothetical protein